jgi:hypothetical protein
MILEDKGILPKFENKIIKKINFYLKIEKLLTKLAKILHYTQTHKNVSQNLQGKKQYFVPLKTSIFISKDNYLR